MDITEEQIKSIIKNNKPESASFRLGDDGSRLHPPSEYAALNYSEFAITFNKINFIKLASGSPVVDRCILFKLFNNGETTPLVSKDITEDMFTLLYKETEKLQKEQEDRKIERLNKYINGA